MLLTQPTLPSDLTAETEWHVELPEELQAPTSDD